MQEQLNGHGPLLVGFLANDDPAAIKYAQWTAQSLQADGLRFEIRTVDKLDLEKSIAEANEDPAGNIRRLRRVHVLEGNTKLTCTFS